MQRRERIPLHDHADRNSGGLIAARTVVTQVVSSGGTGSATVPNAADVPIADVGGYFTGTNVEAALGEIGAHPGDATDAHDASAVSFDPTGLANTAATDVQTAIADLDGAIGSPALALDGLTDVNAPTPTDQDVLTWDDGAGEWIAQAAPGAGGGDTAGQFIAGWDGGGSVLSAGAKVDIVAPFSGTITGWTLLADQSGSAVVDIWNDVLGSFPPTDADSITAAAPPTLTGATNATSAAVGTWDAAVTAGDVLRFNLDSASTVTRLLLVVAYSRP